MMTESQSTAVMMPHSRAAEESLIGSMLIDPESINRIPLSPEDFYIRRNGMIWRAMKDLAQSGAYIDFVTVSTKLDERHQLGDIGGLAYLMSLINQTPSSLHAESYADTIRERARRRKIILASQELASKAFDLQADVSGAVGTALDTLSRSVVQTKGARHISEYVKQVWDEIDEAIKNPRELAGISTGFPDWDSITSGMMPGEKMLLSGPPGLGKSLLAAQVLQHVAEQGIPTALYELEMSAQQVIRRTLSGITRRDAGHAVATRQMLTGKIDDLEIVSLIHAVEKLSCLPVYISEASEMTSLELRADLTRLVEQEGVQMFVLDYEGLLTDDPDRKEVERYKLISSRVKAICKDLKLSGIVISDMTKDGITGDTSGQGAVAGPARSLHDADQIVVMREEKAASAMTGKKNKVITLTWEKMREGEAGRFMNLVKLAGFPMFASVEKEKKK